MAWEKSSGYGSNAKRVADGRISKVTYPDGGERRISYDAANRPSTITLPQGTVVNAGHDAVGRETSRTTSTGEYRYLTYGVGDRIETMTDPTGTTDYEYDQAGRFAGIVYPSGASVRYTRDKLGRTTDVRVKPSASAAELVTHYDFDPNGNLAEITDPNGGVTGFAYDDVDRLQQRMLANGVVTTYGYDSRDRVLSVVHKNAQNVVLASVIYERSPSGEPTKITREDGSYVRIEYDSALRVSKESHFDANDVLVAEMTYGYDLDGNRTSKTTLTGNETYSYAAGFRLTSVSHSTGGADDGFTYDNGGRVTGITRDGTTKTLEYDSSDHITKVIDGGIESVRYTFDGAGNRVAADDGTGVKRFLVAPNMGASYESPQAVTDGSGNLIASYVYAGEHPIMKIKADGSVEYMLADEMGSVLGKANQAGASTAAIHYSAFGEITSATGASSGIDPSVGFEHRMHGMISDAATGLYFVRARSYDAKTGRFISRDPFAGVIRLPETMQPYAFNRSCPTTWRDPTGRFSLMEVSVAGGIVGILAAIATPQFAEYLRRARGAKAGSFLATSNFHDEGLRMVTADIGLVGDIGAFGAALNGGSGINTDRLLLKGTAWFVGSLGPMFAGLGIALGAATLPELVALFAVSGGFIVAGWGIANLADGRPFFDSAVENAAKGAFSKAFCKFLQAVEPSAQAGACEFIVDKMWDGAKHLPLDPAPMPSDPNANQCEDDGTNYCGEF